MQAASSTPRHRFTPRLAGYSCYPRANHSLTRGAHYARMKRFLVLLMLFALASCGGRERPPQFRLYGPANGGDTTAWSNPPFDGDKTTWRLHAKDRAQHETEYGAR